MTETEKIQEISLVDTAKIIREELKTYFPNTKFSVRSDRYAGGCSIDITWIDGDSLISVNEIVKKFEKTELKGISHKDKLLKFRVDYVNTQRTYSDDAFSKLANTIAKDLGIEKTFKTKEEIVSYRISYDGCYLSDLTYQEIIKINI